MATHPAPAHSAGLSPRASTWSRLQLHTRSLVRIVAFAATAAVATAASVPRPWGLAYTPSYVPTYDASASSADIPSDALDRSSYTTTSDWLAACLAQNKAGKIGSGTYSISSADLKRYAPKGIYGYGTTKPVFNYTGGTIANSTPGFLYLGKYTTFKARYLEFRNFGDVFNLAVGSVDRGTGLYKFQDTSQSAFCRHCPTGDVLSGDDGVGLIIDTTLFPRTTSTIGPAVDISHCRFYRCQRAYAAGSDSVAHGRLDFHENVLDGTYGGVDLNVLSMTEVYAAKNEWFGLDATWYAPPNKSHSFHTLFKLGVENGTDIELRTQKIYIENNYAHGILDKNTEPGNWNISSGVFLDVRNATPTTYTSTSDPALLTSDISISYNQIVDVRNDWGHEDSNAIYGKLRGGVLERNYIKNCGAAFVSAGAQNGAEGTGMVFKDAWNMATAPTGSTLAIRGNVFEDMPACPSTISDSSLSVVKLDLNNPVALVFIGNDFINCDNAGTSGSSGLMRHYGEVNKVTAWGNTMENCVISSVAHFLAFHNFSSPASGHEVSNNIAVHGADVNYTADQVMIKFNGTPAGYVTGQNVLDGSSANYVMQSTPAGSGTASVRTYTPPTIPATSVAAPAFSPGGGTYSSTQNVTITTSTSGATIRYTTNGTTPTSTTGTVYSGPVSISATSTLKAIAYKSGMADSTVSSATYTITGGGGSGAFQMSANEVVMEAEHFTSKVTAGGVTWTEITDTGASGAGSNNAMQAAPNTGASSSAPGSGVARMDYQIDVPSGSASNFYVHLRTRATTTTDDSVWVSIDGGTTTYQQMGALTTGYSWRTSNSSFAIPSGLHTITIWMREDGMIVDKIVVRNNSTAPTGTGPAESPQN